MVKTVSHQKYPIIWFLKPQTICPDMIHSRFPKILLVMVICVFIVYLDRNVDRSFSSAPLRHSFYCLICIFFFFAVLIDIYLYNIHNKIGNEFQLTVCPLKRNFFAIKAVLSVLSTFMRFHEFLSRSKQLQQIYEKKVNKRWTAWLSVWLNRLMRLILKSTLLDVGRADQFSSQKR